MSAPWPARTRSQLRKRIFPLFLKDVIRGLDLNPMLPRIPRKDHYISSNSPSSLIPFIPRIGIFYPVLPIFISLFFLSSFHLNMINAMIWFTAHFLRDYDASSVLQKFIQNVDSLIRKQNSFSESRAYRMMVLFITSLVFLLRNTVTNFHRSSASILSWTQNTEIDLPKTTCRQWYYSYHISMFWESMRSPIGMKGISFFPLLLALYHIYPLATYCTRRPQLHRQIEREGLVLPFSKALYVGASWIGPFMILALLSFLPSFLLLPYE